MTDDPAAATERPPMVPPRRDQEFITVHEAASLLQVSTGTVERWLESGVLSAHRDASGRDLLSPNAVEALAARRGGRPQRDRQAVRDLSGVVPGTSSW